MKVGPLHLSLVVPGLLGPLPGMGRSGFPEPDWPALSLLLARAHRSDRAGDSERLTYELLGYPFSERQDRPDAWLSYQIDTGGVPEGPILRADPVHLRADQSRLLLFGPEQLGLSQAEAAALAASIDEFLKSDGLSLHAATPDRWYLRLHAMPHIVTTPLRRALGRDIDQLLPHGTDARRWHALINEIQMLLHTHEINQAREAQGRPTVNSIWVWGGGSPVAPVAQSWQGIWSDDLTSIGLARLNRLQHAGAPRTGADWLHQVVGDRHLAVLDDLTLPVAYGDIEAWKDQVEKLDADWFKPLLGALRSGRLSELCIYPATGFCFRIRRWDLLRLWRGVRSPLTQARTGPG